MNNYIKHIVEAFDFNNINNQKKSVNVYDVLLQNIKEKISGYEKLTDEDYNLLKSAVGIYKVSSKTKLKELIEYFIKQFGNECTLNWIDVSNINDMSELFYFSDFNGDISKWNVSNVIDMYKIFYQSKFTGDISKWNVSNVADMSCMFYGTDFNGDISRWDVSNIINMSCMFFGSKFNNDISKWDVSSVEDMSCMFKFTEFNGDISRWDVSSVTDMHGMFMRNPDFKGDLSKWDVSSVTDMEDMFNHSEFNGDIGNWDVSNVTNMAFMFSHSKFNRDISNWDVSNVTDMYSMFGGSQFNRDISKWDVSNVKDMHSMFEFSNFNGNISNWDVSNVTDMVYMFAYSKFNGDISNWDVSNVKNMYSMFSHSKFNGDISNWDVSNVKNMSFMFNDAEFNHNISNWNINNVTNKICMFADCKIESFYKPKKKKKLEEGFDFDSVDKKKIMPSLSMKDKVLLFDNFLKDLYDKHILTGMQYGNKYFSDAWTKAKTDQEFNGTYYKCEADGDHLNVELNYMNLYFQSPEDYNQFCEDIKIFKDIRINGQLSIYMKTLSLCMQRLENFGELGKTITFVKELDINNLILHDFEGMPEVKSFKANNSTIFTFNGFKYKDAVKDIELYYKPGQHCVIDWTGFPKKLYGIFSYKLNIDSDSLAAYTMAFERQLTTLSGFPDDFMYISDPENVMHVGQPNFVDINMEKWQRDKIKLHIMDLLLQSFPNKQKRDKLYKRLTKIYRYR